MKIRLAIVEASEVVRIGLRDILNACPDVTVMGAYAHPQSVFTPLQNLHLDILILSESIGSKAVCSTLRQISQQALTVKVLLLANTLSEEKIHACSRDGVAGFVYKTDHLSIVLPQAVEALHTRQHYLSPEATRILLEKSHQTPPLTHRAMQVLRLMGQNLTVQDIASEMQTTPTAIYSIQHRLREALEVRSSGQIVVEAIRRGWLDVSEAD